MPRGFNTEPNIFHCCICNMIQFPMEWSCRHIALQPLPPLLTAQLATRWHTSPFQILQRTEYSVVPFKTYPTLSDDRHSTGFTVLVYPPQTLNTNLPSHLHWFLYACCYCYIKRGPLKPFLPLTLQSTPWGWNSGPVYLTLASNCHPPRSRNTLHHFLFWSTSAATVFTV